MSRNRKAPDLPLIISAPKSLELGTCIILGIPPLRQNSPKKYVSGVQFLSFSNRWFQQFGAGFRRSGGKYKLRSFVRLY
jgi:hypothetical protein